MAKLDPSVFQLVDTHGTPLWFIVDVSKKRGQTPNWPVFIEDATKAGWSRKKIESMILDAIRLTYDDEGIARVKEELPKYLPEEKKSSSQVWKPVSPSMP